MIFDSISIENINSFNDTQNIDLTTLNQSGLFIISGATGAGKSTILNSISLALFGKTYKKDLYSHDFVTLGKEKGKIDLIFTNKNKKFRAIWECKNRKKDGTLLKKPITKRILYKLKEQDWVPEECEIEEIIGLDHDQFVKTVVLNQGEFSKFLSSSFTERRKILEGLNNEEFLKDLSPQLFSNIKSIQTDINSNESQLEKLVADEIDIEKIEKEEINIKDRLEKVKDKRLIKSDVLVKLKEIFNLKTTFERLTKELNSLREKHKISTKEKVSFKAAYQKEKNLLENLEKEYNELLPNLNKAKEILLKSNTLEEYIREKKLEIETINEKFFDLKKDNEKKSVQINTLESEIQKIKIKEDLDTLRDQFQKNQKRYKQRLEVYNILNSKIMSINQKKDVFSKESENLKLLNYQEKEYVDLLNKKENLNKKIEKQTQKLNLLKNNSSLLKVYLSSIEDYQIQQNQLKKISLPRISDLKELGKNLNKIEETTDSSHLIKLFKNDITDWITQEKQLEKLNSQIDQMKSKIESLIEMKFSAQNIKQYTFTIESLENKLELDTEKQNQNNINFKDLETKRLQHLELHKRTEQLKLEIKTESDSLEEYQDIDKVKAELKDYETRENELNEKLKLEREHNELVKERAKLIEQRNYQIELINSLEKQKSIATQKHKNSVTEYDHMIKELQGFNLKKSPDSILEEYQSEINRLRESVDKLNTKGKNLEIELTRQFSQIENNKNNQEQTIDLIAQNIESTKSHNLFSQSEADDILKLENIVLESKQERIKEEIASLEQDYKELSHRLGEITEQVKHNKKIQNEIKIIKDRLKKLKASKEDLDLLFLVIGKDEFRNFVLRKLEEILVTHANYELKKLYNGRFNLVHGGKKDKEFYIIDHYNLSEIRKVSTLSGGELFIVSLCLALGLSEATRGNSEINSFFIDEGFGTLDKESLSEVIEVLYGLKKRGKVIGIISHVEELKESISSKIQLHKDSQGRSQVSVSV